MQGAYPQEVFDLVEKDINLNEQQCFTHAKLDVYMVDAHRKRLESTCDFFITCLMSILLSERKFFEG